MPWTDKQVAHLRAAGVQPEHVEAALAKLSGSKARTGLSARGPVKHLAEGGEVKVGDPIKVEAEPKKKKEETLGEKIERGIQAFYHPKSGTEDNQIAGEGGDIIAETPASAPPVAPPPTATPVAGPGTTPVWAASDAVPSGMIAQQFGGMDPAAITRPTTINPAPLQEAAKQVGIAQAAQADQVAAAHKVAAEHLQAMDTTFTADQAQRQAKIRAAQARLASNPVSEWSGGQKVMAAISIALGGLGGALTGTGRNAGLDAINQAVDREINIRKTNMEAMHEQFRDSSVAYNVMRAGYLQQVEQDIAARVSQTANPVVKAQAAQLAAQVGQEATKANNEATLKFNQNQIEAQNKHAQLLLQYGQRLVPDDGKTHIAPSEGEATKAREFMAARKTIFTTADKLLQLGKEGRTLPASKRDALAQQYTAELQEALRSGLGEGVFRAGEFSFFKQIIDNPISWNTMNLNAQLEKVRGLKKFMDVKKDGLFSSWGQGGSEVSPNTITSFKRVGG